MRARFVSELVKAQHPYALVDMPPTEMSVLHGYNHAERYNTKAGRTVGEWLLTKFYSLAPGGTTEILNVRSREDESEARLDLEVIRGEAIFLRWREAKGTIEEAQLRRGHSRSIRESESFFLANINPGGEFIFRADEIPRLTDANRLPVFSGSSRIEDRPKAGETESRGIDPPVEFYEAIGRVLARHA